MTTVLDQIVAQRRLDVEEARAALPEDELAVKALASPFQPCDFYALLRSHQPMSLIAEIKRASPSKGDIAVNMDAAEQALKYAAAGACAISVLTEPKWFKGNLDDMLAVRTALESLAAANPSSLRPGVLRKDFVIDRYQILEARVYGADTILLIVKCLSQEQLVYLLSEARSFGFEPLVEVSDAEETSRAISAGAKIIGVNNRNLVDFTVDMSRTSTLATLIPRDSDIVLVALSGIATRKDVSTFAQSGASSVLVGEALMRALDPGLYIKWLLGQSVYREPLVKICGVSTVEAALAAARNGADLIGMVFVPVSKRFVPPERAKEITQAIREFRSAKRTESGEALLELQGLAGGGASSDGSSGWSAKQWTTVEWFSHTAEILQRALHQQKPLVVGVFADTTVDSINAAVEATGIDLVQLHGNSEPAGLSLRINRPVIRAIHVAPHDTAKSVVQQLVPARYAFVLLDTHIRVMPEPSPSPSPVEPVLTVTALHQGGSGVSFDWKVAKDVLAVHGLPVLVAGGLTPENVTECAYTAFPWGVDVSSGVEANGQKDLAKIAAFISAAKAVH